MGLWHILGHAACSAACQLTANCVLSGPVQVTWDAFSRWCELVRRSRGGMRSDHDSKWGHDLYEEEKVEAPKEPDLLQRSLLF